MSKKKVTTLDFEVNVLFMMSIAMDLIMRDTERRMKALGGWKQDKKQTFTRYTDAVKRACILQDDLMQSIYNVEAQNSYKNVQLWQEEANELVRAILLYADRCTDVDTVEKVHNYLRSLPSEENLCDEKLLERFYLKKL